MKITLELPDPKFKVGDVVRIQNEHNDRSIYLKITRSEMDGSWRWDSDQGMSMQLSLNGCLVSHESEGEMLAWFYTTEVLPDSWKDTQGLFPLEGVQVFNVTELETMAELVTDMAEAA